MSFGLSVYVIDLAVARGAIGSGDEKQRRMIGGRFKRRLAADDSHFSFEIERGAPTRYEALRAVIDGGPYDERHAFQYAYAYQLICEFHGRPCFNNHFSPFKSGWLERVDKGMAALGIDAATVGDFMYGGLPPGLPRPDDLPDYGEWSVDQCRRALAQWEASTPEQRQALDREVLEAIESCTQWWRDAIAVGRGVAGFVH
ncbi:hypothetical protein ACFOVU_28720 [Nocardiopsis sediminis]|uniref:DUF7691 domain-containing protein n=1 Tax=Nocardiopsis sediminis TaxID=1778267 RepID=A0ABV8FWV6_9ACTN